MPSLDNVTLARVLLAKAIEDETLVRTVADNHEIADAIVGFHAQQAVEKLLKAVLAAHGVTYAKSHDLDYLIDLVEQSGIDAPDELDGAEALSPWAVELRYEQETPASLDRKKALEPLTPLRVWAEREIETAAKTTATGPA
jgi:HEPN domain-containing protein